MDIFISHSSKDNDTAQRLQQLLSKAKLPVWLDQSNIRLGVLLRKELQNAIRKCKAVVLIWSKHAAKSRWVAAEIITAFHLKRPIISYACDKKPLPYFLQNDVYLTSHLADTVLKEQLRRTILSLRKGTNEVILTRPVHSPEQRVMIQKLAEGQQKLLSRMMNSDTQKLWPLQQALEDLQMIALEQWPLDATILNLAGYHHKNAYTLKHWQAIQAGRPPKDKLLEKAERHFFDSLFADPFDYSALNGLGSILIYERDYEAAAFFIQKAIELARKDGVVYQEAIYDLAMIQRINKPIPN